MNGEHKITGGHRARTALIYLRQSTRDPGPRAHRVDAAAVRAGRYCGGDGLGTAGCRGDRPGPGPVRDVGGAPAGVPGADVAGVRLGEIGAAFGLEIPRLGLVQRGPGPAGGDGPADRYAAHRQRRGYDLADFNDWLVLGLKSTMSQAELHIMAGRLQAARRAAAERGELRAPLPVGLVYDDDGMVVTDPDAEVRAAVADIFACFLAAGIELTASWRRSPARSSPARLRRRLGRAAALGAADPPPGAAGTEELPPTPAPTFTAGA